MSRRNAWVLLAGAAIASIAAGAYELGPASVTPLVRDSLGIGPSAAALLVSIMIGTGVVTSVPIGVVLDRTDTRLALAAGVGFLFLAGGWSWVAVGTSDYPQLLASRILGGVGFTVIWNAGIDLVSRAVGDDYRATALGAYTASTAVGFALGQATSPLIAEVADWSVLFLVFPAMAAVGLVLAWLGSRDLGDRGAEGAPDRAAFRRVLTAGRVWLLGGLVFLAFALYLFVNTWAPSYLTEELGLSLAAAGALSALFPAVGALSRVTGGLLSDRVFGGRRRPVILLSFVVVTPLVAGFTLLPHVAFVVAALLGAGYAVQLSIGIGFAFVRELVEPTVATTAVAVLTSLGLSGAFLSPIAGGAVIEAAGYGTAFAAAGALGLAGLGLAWISPEG